MALQRRQRINYLISEIDALYHEASLKLGLSDSEMQIMYAIRDKNGSTECSIRDILTFSGLAKQTINSALRKMEKSGWLHLKPSAGKNKTVALSDKGIEVARKTADVLIDIENNIFNAWSSAQADSLLSLAQKYLTELDKKVRLLSDIN